MAQVLRKWITDRAINNEKIDEADVYTITGLLVDSTSAAGRVGIGITSPLDAIHIKRPDTSAGLMLDLDDGGSGRNYQIYSSAAGVLNVKDIDTGNDRFTLNGVLGKIGINITDPLDTVHARATTGSAALRLDLDDGANGRAYQFASNASGDLTLADLDDATTRLTLSSIGSTTIHGDATVLGGFEVFGTVTVINTEIIVTDQLEINQTDATQAALIASNDNVAATGTVVKIENLGSGPALTVDNGPVGIGTTNPVAQLHVEGDIVGKVSASGSNIGSPTRRISTIYMNSHINHVGNLNFNGTNVVFDSTNGRVGIGVALPTVPLDVLGAITSSATITGGTVTSNGALNGSSALITNGITATAGPINCTNGSINATSGTITGNIITSNTVVNGASALITNGITATAGPINCTNGNINATSGTITALNVTVTGTLTASGTFSPTNIGASGYVTAGSYITATTGPITCTNGSINATSGTITGATVTSNGALNGSSALITNGITATAGPINCTNGAINATSGTITGATVNSNGTITAGTGLTVTTGNIAVSSGTLSVSSTSTLTGKVGIGKAPTAYWLDVIGNINADGNIDSGGTITGASVVATGGFTGATLDINSTTVPAATIGHASAPTLNFATTGPVTNGQIWATSSTFTIAATSGGNSLALNSNGVAAITCNTATPPGTRLWGDVGIGVAAPGVTANWRKLHITGGAVTGMIECDGSGTPEVKIGSVSNHSVAIYVNNTTSRLACLASAASPGNHLIACYGNTYVNGTFQSGNIGINVAPSSYSIYNNGTAYLVGKVGIATPPTGNYLEIISPDANAALYARNHGAGNAVMGYVAGAGFAGLFTGPVSVTGTTELTGGVGIGVAPVSTTKLNVLADVSGGHAAYFFNDGNNTNRAGIAIQCGPDTPAALTWNILDSYSGAGAPEGGLEVNSGTFQIYQVSDRNLKKNIVDTAIKGREKIIALRVRDFSWKEDVESNLKTGFIAQEVMDIIPDSVNEKAAGKDEDGKQKEETVLSFAPTALIPTMVKALQEQDELIQKLTDRVLALENQ